MTADSPLLLRQLGGDRVTVMDLDGSDIEWERASINQCSDCGKRRVDGWSSREHFGWQHCDDCSRLLPNEPESVLAQAKDLIADEYVYIPDALSRIISSVLEGDVANTGEWLKDIRRDLQNLQGVFDRLEREECL